MFGSVKTCRWSRDSSSTNLYSMQTFGLGLIHLSFTYAFDKPGYISSKEQVPIEDHILWFRKKRNKNWRFRTLKQTKKDANLKIMFSTNFMKLVMIFYPLCIQWDVVINPCLLRYQNYWPRSIKKFYFVARGQSLLIVVWSSAFIDHHCWVSLGKEIYLPCIWHSHMVDAFCNAGRKNVFRYKHYSEIPTPNF